MTRFDNHLIIIVVVVVVVGPPVRCQRQKHIPQMKERAQVPRTVVIQPEPQVRALRDILNISVNQY